MKDRLYKRGHVWWCWYYLPTGECIRRTTKCTDRKAAAETLRRLEREGSGAVAPRAAPHSLSDCLKYFIAVAQQTKSEATLEIAECKSRHVLRVHGEVDVNSITLEDNIRYSATRIGEKASRETVRKEFVCLRSALKLAARRKLYVGDVASIFPVFKVDSVPRERFLTHAEYKKLHATLTGDHQFWLLLAVYTGGRDSEVDGLTWENVDFRAKTIFLPGTKTKKSRRKVPLHPALMRVLKKKKQDAGVIIGNWKNINRDLRAACDRVGIPPVTPNDLRRTFASWLKQAGVDSRVVADLLGHSTTAMVDRVYGHLTLGTLQAAVAKLPG